MRTRTRETRRGLHAGFLKLWAAQTASILGDQVTALALPLVAIINLHAQAEQLGLLRAANRAPFLLFGLFAGVWVDRLRRRPLMIAADLGRGLLIGLILPVSLMGKLSIGYLAAMAFAVGILTVFFDLAQQSFVPHLVGRDRLVESNSRLTMTGSVVQLAGPGLAGILIQILTAPFAMIIDALSFFVSAIFLGLIGSTEPIAAGKSDREPVWRQIGEGLGVVLHNPLLWANMGCRATLTFFSSLMITVYFLYLNQDLRFTPVAIGLIVASSGPSGLVAGMVASRLARSVRLGWILIGTAAITGLGQLLIPLAAGSSVIVLALFVVSGWLTGCCGTLYDLLQLSLRQAITPLSMIGRMTATVRFAILGVAPLGALAGGQLGEVLGLRTTLFVGAIGSSLAFLWLLLSPVRTLNAMPEQATATP